MGEQAHTFATVCRGGRRSTVSSLFSFHLDLRLCIPGWMACAVWPILSLPPFSAGLALQACIYIQLFMWDLGFDLTSSGVYGKCFYWVSHPGRLQFLLEVCVCGVPNSSAPFPLLVPGFPLNPFTAIPLVPSYPTCRDNYIQFFTLEFP